MIPKILHCGYPRSGNYLLHTILRYVLYDNKITYFSQKVGLSYIWKITYKQYNLNELFPGYLNIDMIRVYNSQLFLCKMHKIKFLENIKVDKNLFFKTASLVWSNDNLKNLACILENFDHIIYIVRDGRDAINSFIHFYSMPHIQKFFEKHRKYSVEDVYSNIKLFKKFVRLWTNHVSSYFEIKKLYPFQKKIILLRFEDLIKDKNIILDIFPQNILNKKISKTNLTALFSFYKMKKSANHHLNFGHAGTWKNYFKKEHMKIFEELAGNYMEKLGYT